MRIVDVLTTKAIALYYTQVHSNDIPLLGLAMFPRKKKMGLDLKWIKGHKGLPVMLQPSAFDTKSKFRDRIGIELTKTQMSYFKESMLVSEEDEQEILRVVESGDPYLIAALQNIYNDAEALITSADIVAERMIWQLLTATDGQPKISINANGVDYDYVYGGTDYKANNFVELTTATDKWSDTANSDPMSDIDMIVNKALAKGVRLSAMIISPKTMGYLVANTKIKSYILAQNSTANIFMNKAKVKEAIKEQTGINVIVYEKMFKDLDGADKAFVPDTTATFIPAGNLGFTWYGTSPIERTGMGSKDADVSIVNTGVNVMKTIDHDPENTKITVDEIVLPSFESIDSVFILKHS